MASGDKTYPDADNWISANEPTTNWNGRSEIRVGDQGGANPPEATGIIRFTMPSDPGGGNVIDSIVFWAKTESLQGSDADEITIYQGTNTAATTFSESTSTYGLYSTGNSWAADGARSDFTREISTRATLTVDETYYDWPILGGSTTNDADITWGEVLALQLIMDDVGGVSDNQHDLHNRETAGTTQDPYIVVTYSVPAASDNALAMCNF